MNSAVPNKAGISTLLPVPLRWPIVGFAILLVADSHTYRAGFYVSGLATVLLATVINIINHRQDFGFGKSMLLFAASCIVSILMFAGFYVQSGLVASAPNVVVQNDKPVFEEYAESDRKGDSHLVYGWDDSLECIYFSIVTWTTLGFGDLRPTQSSKCAASLEALVGYLYMAIGIGIVLRCLGEANCTINPNLDLSQTTQGDSDHLDSPPQS